MSIACSSLSQLGENQDQDFILIFDGNSLISRLSGTDSGPYPENAWGSWYKKILSSSSKMMIEFRSDDWSESPGFSASIQFTTQSQSQICESSLDMNKKTLLSPNYPNSYNNNISCYWLITVRHGFHIELKFQEFDVRVLNTVSAQIKGHS